MKINSYELEGKLKQQIEGVYIFSGNDPFWLDEATATVQNYAVKAGFTKDNIYTFSDDELKTDELIEAMSSPGLFADRVLVKLKIHDLKVKGKKTSGNMLGMHQSESASHHSRTETEPR